VVVCIVGELKNVRRDGRFVLGSVAIVCGVFLENRICVGGDILVRVDGDE